MAGRQPILAAEKDTPGAFPVTPAVEEQTFSVNPIPKSEGAGNPITLAPGAPVPPSSTLHGNTIDSTVHDDPELKKAAEEQEQTFKVAPLPATGGAGNPVTLAPGEPVPEASTITGHTTSSNIKLDEASYDKADTVLPVLPKEAPVAGGLAAGSSAAAGAAFLGGPGPQTTNMIPESSMGMGPNASIEPSPFTSSAGPSSTTAALAGQVPLEPRGVPAVVSESQQEAHVSPEASANQGAVEDKKQVENELQQKISETPVTSDETHKEAKGSTAGIAGAVAGGAAAVGAAAAGAFALGRGKVEEKTGKDPVAALPASVQTKIKDINDEADRSKTQTSADAVPSEVVESQKAAHVSAEASANPEAVHEKKLVEDELKSKVSPVETSGTPAPTVAAATSTTAPSTTAAGATSTQGAPQLAPVAGVAPISMDTQGLNAPASSQAIAPASAAAQTPDVSATSKPSTAQQTAPVVTTGVGSSAVPRQSTPSTPQSSKEKSKRFSLLGGHSDASPSPSGSTDKKEKRKSLFSRIKEKLK